tara:strand:- start:5381 stop:6013 length:633 start_codon:yes stop_codon:yes gene_type:complete
MEGFKLTSVLLMDVVLPTGAIILSVLLFICSTINAPVNYHLNFSRVLKRLGVYNFFVAKAVKKAQVGQPRFVVFSHGHRISRKNFGKFADGYYLMVWKVFPVRLEDVDAKLNGRVRLFNSTSGITYFDQSDQSAQSRIALQNNFRYILLLLRQEHVKKKIATCSVKDGYIDIGIKDTKISASELRDELINSGKFAEVALSDSSLTVSGPQ